MTPDEYQEVQQVFLELRSLDGLARNVKLAEIGQFNASLAVIVQELLAADAVQDSFLASPAGDGFIRNAETMDSTSSGPGRVDNSMRDYEPVSPDDQDLPRQIGPYRILQRIGEGGHGVVFMAEQAEPIRRRVAIKWIKPGMESKMILARFEAERQSLAMMKHPSIANVIDAGTTETGRPYFVMELVHGIPIDRFCEENRLSLNERLGLFGQVCAAVHHAHQKGIIHRDIKPANVLVTLDSGQSLAKVIDFGIAKAMHLTLTEKTMFTEYGQIIGTLEYMSPEQATMSQNTADVRSDVYSLGALLYLLLTGQTPISKDELLRKGIWELKNVLQDYCPATPSLRVTSAGSATSSRNEAGHPEPWVNRLKGDLDWITMKALAKEPDQRYDSPAALAQDIGNFLRGDAISARPPSVWYTSTKFVRRHRVASVIAAAILGSALVSFAAVTWGYFKSQQNLTAAEDAERSLAEKANALQVSLKAVETQKARADLSSRRMAKMLERNILETSWSRALDGDAKQAQTSLQDIANEDRGFVWRLIDSVSRQMDWPSLRNESAGAIRQSAVHRDLGMMAIITTESRLEVWDVAARQQVQNMQLEPDLYSSISFSSDGRKLLVGRSSDSVQVIELSNRSVGPVIRHRLGGTRDAVHDPGGHRWFVTTGANYLIELAEGMREPSRTVKLPSRVDNVTLSSDGQWLVVAGLDGACYLIATEGLSQCQEIRGSRSEVLSFRWSADKMLAVNSVGTLLSIPVAEFAESGETEEVRPANGLAFSIVDKLGRVDERASAVEIAENDSLLIGDTSGQVRLTIPGLDVPVAIRKYSPSITGLTLFENPRTVAVTHFNGRVNLISWQDIECRSNEVEQLSDLTDGIGLGRSHVSITGHASGKLKRWNTATGQLLDESQLHHAEIFSLSVHERTGRVATMAADWKIQLSDLNDLQPIHILSVDLGVRPVEFSRSGSLLAGAPSRENPIGLREGTVDLWDVKTGRSIKRLVGHSNWVIQIQFTADDSRLATLALDGSTKIWSVESGMCLNTIDLSKFATPTQIQLLDHDRIAVAHADGTIGIHNLMTGELLLTGQILNNRIGCIISPGNSGCLIVSSDDEPTLTCVDANSLNLIARLDSGTGDIIGLRTDMDWRRVQILGERGAIRIWDLPATDIIPCE